MKKSHRIRIGHTKNTLKVSLFSRVKLILHLGKYTLVIEIVDILVRIVDISIDNFYLQDVAISEISVKGRVNKSLQEIVSRISTAYKYRSC